MPDPASRPVRPAAVSAELARALSLHAGDSVEVARGSARDLSSSPACWNRPRPHRTPVPLLVMDIAAAQDVLGGVEWISRVNVRFRPDAAAVSTGDRLSSRLNGRALVSSPDGQHAEARRLLPGLRVNLSALAFTSVFVGPASAGDSSRRRSGGRAGPCWRSCSRGSPPGATAGVPSRWRGGRACGGATRSRCGRRQARCRRRSPGSTTSMVRTGAPSPWIWEPWRRGSDPASPMGSRCTWTGSGGGALPGRGAKTGGRNERATAASVGRASPRRFGRRRPPIRCWCAPTALCGTTPFASSTRPSPSRCSCKRWPSPWRPPGWLSRFWSWPGEEAPDTATFRALGTTRGQLFRFHLGKGAGLAGIGGAPGTVGGAGLAVILIYVTNRAYFGWTVQFGVPALSLLEQGAALALAAVAASWWPALRAAGGGGMAARRTAVTAAVVVAGLAACSSPESGSGDAPADGPLPLPASNAEGWLAAYPDYPWSFPEDHGPHFGYKTEWWYFTGILSARSAPATPPTTGATAPAKPRQASANWAINSPSSRSGFVRPTRAPPTIGRARGSIPEPNPPSRLGPSTAPVPQALPIPRRRREPLAGPLRRCFWATPR